VVAAASLVSNPLLWVTTLIGISVCWSRARIFKSRTGRDPWGMPVWAWVVIGFFFGLIAAILALIATRKSAMAAGNEKAMGYGAPQPVQAHGYGGMPSGAPGLPSAPLGVPSGQADPSISPTSGESGPTPNVFASPGSSIPRQPGWYFVPDNTWEQVYWDGTTWTSRVRWNGDAWVAVT